MLKWVILAGVGIVVVVLAIRIIKVMLKTENESKQENTSTPNQEDTYTMDEAKIDIHSSNNTIMTDMSIKPKQDNSTSDYDFQTPSSGFVDSVDDEFEDFSRYARGGKGRRRSPEDFDLEGDLADEYIPGSPDFSYLPKRQPKKKKSISTELNELPTELKVLMLSDIFDRKFFD